MKRRGQSPSALVELNFDRLPYSGHLVRLQVQWNSECSNLCATFSALPRILRSCSSRVWYGPFVPQPPLVFTRSGKNASGFRPLFALSLSTGLVGYISLNQDFEGRTHHGRSACICATWKIV